MSSCTIECENGHVSENQQAFGWKCPECGTDIGKILKRVRPQDFIPYDGSGRWDHHD